jgi:hypothetical protein
MAISQFLKDEHSKIKKDLEQELLGYFDSLNSDLFENDLEKDFFKGFIEKVLELCGRPQFIIADSIKGVTRYTIHRKTKRLNGFLREFCENRIDPPIQVFYHQLTLLF